LQTKEILFELNASKSIDLIIPCYNPPLNWADNMVERFKQFAEGLSDFKVSLILINDGSSKNISKEQIAFLNQKLNSFSYFELPENRGKGAALRKGVELSSADYIIFTDIDFPFTNQSMWDVAKAINQPNIIVSGYRGMEYYQGIPFFRRILSKSFRRLIKILTGIKTDDTQCGLKAFGPKGKELFLKTTTHRYLFDFEFLKMASKDKGILIQPILVDLREGVSFTSMNIRILLKEFWSFIKLLLK
jgi:glycosyltransferase involved in cell wall biosynthesis